MEGVGRGILFGVLLVFIILVLLAPEILFKAGKITVEVKALFVSGLALGYAIYSSRQNQEFLDGLQNRSERFDLYKMELLHAKMDMDNAVAVRAMLPKLSNKREVENTKKYFVIMRSKRKYISEVVAEMNLEFPHSFDSEYIEFTWEEVKKILEEELGIELKGW